MTEEFKLREPWITLCLCGLDFRIELCQRTAKICSEILNEAKVKLMRLKSKEPDNTANECEICKFLRESIDKLLGIGAVDRLFGERTQELSDLADLMCYIVSKIREGFLEDKKALSSKFDD